MVDNWGWLKWNLKSKDTLFICETKSREKHEEAKWTLRILSSLQIPALERHKLDFCAPENQSGSTLNVVIRFYPFGQGLGYMSLLSQSPKINAPIYLCNLPTESSARDGWNQKFSFVTVHGKKSFIGSKLHKITFKTSPHLTL